MKEDNDNAFKFSKLKAIFSAVSSADELVVGRIPTPIFGTSCVSIILVVLQVQC